MLNPNAQLARYSPWFYTAALYNLVWGCLNIFFPQWMFEVLGITYPTANALWQVVGMFVLVYAPAYWWAARQPFQHRHIILIALIGKICGPVGFAWSALTGQLPLAFGWIILTNDLIWWPAFFAYVREAAWLSGGWWKYAVGE